MSWKSELKKTWEPFDLEGDWASRREDMSHKYSRDDYPPEPEPEPKQDFGSDDEKCKVKHCYAVSCKYNKDNNCTLPVVTLDKKARCRDFQPTDEDLSIKE